MKSKLTRLLSLMLTVFLVLGLVPAVGAASDVSIDAANFPDANFRSVVSQFDKDANGRLNKAELDAVTEIDCSEKHITNLKGIEHFSMLTALVAFQNQISSADLSQNTELKYVDLDGNQLSSMNVSALSRLDTLYLASNKLTSLDVTKNTELLYLDVAKNQFRSLNLSKNPELRILNCEQNQLSALDLSNNPELFILYSSSNMIPVLDLRKTPWLDNAYRLGVNDSDDPDVCEYFYSEEEFAILEIDSSVKVYATDSTEAPNPFTDVIKGKFYYKAVLWAYWKEPQITGGLTATTFGVNKACTREQIVTFLWKANGAPEPTSSTSPFSDVKAGKYYYKAVLWANEQNITGGIGGGKFGVGKPCTREQAVTFLWKAAGSQVPESTESPFTDVTPGKYYYKAVLWANENGVTGGIGGGLFGVGRTCSRAQIVTFLYKAYAE